MKICFLSYRGDMYCGGQGIYLYHITNELHKMGHHIEVIAGPPYPEVAEGITLHKIKSSSTYHHNIPNIKESLKILSNPLDLYDYLSSRLGFFSEPMIFTIKAYFKLKELVSQGRVDIIHDNQSLGYGLLMMKSSNVPVVATIHHPVLIDKDADLAQARSFRERWSRKKFYFSFAPMQSFVSKRVDKVITVSQHAAYEINRLFGVPKNMIKVVYNGIDIDLFKRQDDTPKKPNSLIMVARTEDRKKGLLYLVQALKILLTQNRKVNLTIIDKFPDEDGYAPCLINEYDLDGTVTITGRVTREELVQYYSSSEIAIVPSLYEGFGFPAAEAMSCSVPVISTRAGALPEVIGNDSAGILIPPKDPHSLAEAIKMLLDDHVYRTKIGTNARKRVEEHFTWELAAKEILRIYGELLACSQ